MSTLLWIGAGFLAWKYFGNISEHNRQFAGLRIQISSVKMPAPNKLEISLNVQNPNSQDIIVRSIVGDLYFNSRKISRVSMFKEIVVQGNQQTTLPVTIDLKLAKVLSTLSDLTKNIVNSEVIFKGTVNQNNKAIPYTLQYRLV